jgi:ATP-dependent exoDNAse (exonuclease V) beta subunit
VIADEKLRQSACKETGRSFAVEASAGTGKTTTLVDRILHLVLEKGPKDEPIPLSSVCAITFTEKAAGEMKVRLRQEFERRAGLEGAAGERARAALRDLEAAAISTFHSFAVSLLKERPIEAELDPRFTALDDAQRRLFFREVWEPWINRALLARNGPIEAALRAGIRLETLRGLAETLLQHSVAVRRLKLEPPPTEEQVREQKREFLKEARRNRALAMNSGDKLLSFLETAIAWLEEAACGTVPQNPGNAGAQANWSGGKATVVRVKEFVREIVAFQKSCANLPKQRLFDSVIRWLIGDFLAEWESRKRQSGFLDFDDQLDAARRLLASSRAARSEFRNRYAALLVDEFQDTDPVQLEIVLLLSSADLDQTDPARVRPAPGRLFIVGDPKQSIYRFRGADIETYLETVAPARAQALALERLELTTNFRSVPSILRFVDEAFRDAMQPQGNYQPGYLAFGGLGNRKEERESPSVRILGDRDETGKFIGSGRDFAELEASRIARLVAGIHDSEAWQVEERSAEPGRAGPKWRAAKYGDIAILLPVLTRVDRLEDELRAAGIPYVLEGGKFYYARSEVTSAITVLRALANPNDAAALYGALRSIFFGLSDEDLLRAHLGGAPLDYRVPLSESSPLFRPYRILSELHRQRHDRPASETYERLLRQTGAREVLAVRGFQSLANLGKLARTLRSIQRDKTFSQVVDILIAMDEEGVAESESRLMEEKSDAVRILSIHRAKGLDFPIVIVAGLGFQTGNRRENFLVDLHQQKTFALKIGAKDEGFYTPNWDLLSEDDKRKEGAELTRLLYVALTRARDHLVLCTHVKGKTNPDSEQPAPDFERTRLKPLSEFLTGTLTSGSGLARFIDPRSLPELPPKTPEDTGATKDWGSALRSECAELQRLLSETPGSKTFRTPAGISEGDTLAERSVDTARSRAARLGSAFHEAMEVMDLNSPSTIPVKAAETCVRFQLDNDATRKIAEMMRNCFDSPLFERARTSARMGRRVLREVPYVRPLSADGQRTSTSPLGRAAALSGIEEGKIDLLIEEPDGWVLVDYKTDALPQGGEGIEAAFRSKYSDQIQCYAEALRAMRISVKAAYLLLARPGLQIEVPLAR